MTPAPKPRKRYVARRGEWIEYRLALLGGPCLICPNTSETLHHVVPKSVGGDDVPENLIPLCGSGTTGCHGRVEGRTGGARERVREELPQRVFAYVLLKKGAGWLDRHYPSSGQVAA